ncbi:hypothetical protein DLAC_04738 [Tieghemostelium lacteum]|uniref:Cyclic nucleotide-binding domain-containing protein n=1 Tax=Tieghemostelium lacteum TaxID=361077 RepID=A0A151ZKC2_TIELA|nr:hypothetical protein DLAC_04738 [Tieghemostelium lacteum]|eukprot:KYQ94441.1 hypothetical protein DLAC_04738 [Tieghemostelium lacteum]
MSSTSKLAIKKIKITTDHHIPIDRNTFESQNINNISGIINKNQIPTTNIPTANGNNNNSNNTSTTTTTSRGLSESIQILSVVNSIDLFRNFTISKATDILSTAKKQNYSSGSVIIDLENQIPSNTLWIVVNGKISLVNKGSSAPSSPKSTSEPSSPPVFPTVPTTTTTSTTSTTASSISSSPTIKKRKRENSFLKAQQEDNNNTSILCTSFDSIDEIDEDQLVIHEEPHPENCCFQSGDHFCETSYPSNLFIAETDVELIKFNHNDFQYLFYDLKS